MKRIGFLAYIVVEIAAFVGLIAWLGFWWALFVAIAATAIGVLMLRRTANGVFAQVREVADGRRSAGPALMDTALVAVSVFLLAIPGIVSTALGVLLLVKPVRVALRPVAAYVGAKRVAAFVDQSDLVTVLAGTPRGFGTVVDGDVVAPDQARDQVIRDQSGPRPGYRELPPV